MPGPVPLPPLPNDVILMVEVGSTAHGTGIPGTEDHDQLVVYVESQKSVLGIGGERGDDVNMRRTQPEGTQSGPGDTDRTEYPLRKFLGLAAKGNPSIMLALWAPIEMSKPLGLEMRGLAPYFISRSMVDRYLGYMKSQAMRLVGTKGGGHGKRGGGGRPELIEAFGYDCKYAMHAARLGFQCLELLDTGGLALPVGGEVGDWLRDVRHGRVSFEDWWERALDLYAEVEARREDPDLPPRADFDAIDQWSVMAHRQTWGLTKLGHWDAWN